MKRNRVIDPSQHRVTTHKNVDSFCGPAPTPPGINVVDYGGVPIDFLNVPSKGAKTTFVLLHGAMEKNVRLPVLSGAGVTRGLPASRIFISDPSLLLSEDLTLAWYAGNTSQPRLQDHLARMIEKVFHEHGTEQLIFFGGSGAGFAGLRLAAEIEGAKVLLWNAQTIIARYGAQPVRRFAELAFDIDPYEYDPLSLIPQSVTLDLRPLYASPTGTSVAYMQNTSDTTHIERHFKPFMETLNPDNEVHLLAGDWGLGHTPPPKDLLKTILSSVVDHGWAVGISQHGFTRVTSETISSAI